MAVRTLPGRAATTAATPAAAAVISPGWRRSALPMLVAALLIGPGSATFWTYAVDQVRDAGLDQAIGRVLLGGASIVAAAGLLAPRAHLIADRSTWTSPRYGEAPREFSLPPVRVQPQARS
jgi:hypothetical protein